MEIEDLSIGASPPPISPTRAAAAGLQAKWLYYSYIDENLRLSFTDVIPRDKVLTLQVGSLAIEFQGGASTYTWKVDAVDWEDGQTIAARIVKGANTPATGRLTITGEPPRPVRR